MNSLRRRLGVGAVVLLLLALSAPALAADEAVVASNVNDQGFYLDPGVSISASEANRLVEHASFSGEFVYLVVLNDVPPGGAVLFADSVADRVDEGLVVVFTPESVGYSGSSGFQDRDVDAALDVADAIGGADDAQYATAFIEALTGVPVGEPVGAGVTTTVAAAQPTNTGEGSSGGGGGFLLFILIVGGLGLLLWFVMRGRRKKAAAQPPAMSERIVQARAVVQRQLDDVANDVLDLAEEVQLADNPQVDEYYERASATYAAASDEFPGAKDAQSIIDLSQRLDEAIWELDAAEAILDGRSIPPKPVKERIVIEPEAAPTPDVQRQRPSYPSYERRPGRRSSYSGGGLFDILMGVGSVLASTRGRRGGGLLGGLGRRTQRPSGGGGLFGGRQTTTRRPSRTSRGSGGMFGGIGKVDTKGSPRSGSSSRSARSSSKRSPSRSSGSRSRTRGGRSRR